MIGCENREEGCVNREKNKYGRLVRQRRGKSTNDGKDPGEKL